MKLMELIQDNRPNQYRFKAFWVNAETKQLLDTQFMEHCAFFFEFPEKFGYTRNEVLELTGFNRNENIDYAPALMELANDRHWVRVQISNSSGKENILNIQSTNLKDIHTVARILIKIYGAPDILIYDTDVDRFTTSDKNYAYQSQILKGRRLQYFLRTGKRPPETLREDFSPVAEIAIPFRGWINPHLKRVEGMDEYAEHTAYAQWYHEKFGITDKEMKINHANRDLVYNPNMIKLMNEHGWVRVSLHYDGFYRLAFNIQSTRLLDVRATLGLLIKQVGFPDILYWDTDVETFKYYDDEKHILVGNQIKLFAKTGKIPSSIKEDINTDFSEEFTGWYNPDSNQAVSVGYETHAEFVVRHPEMFGFTSNTFDNLDISRIEVTNSAPEIDNLMFGEGWIRAICNKDSFLIHGDDWKRMYLTFRFAAKKLNIIPPVIIIDFQETKTSVKSYELTDKNINLYAKTGRVPRELALVEFVDNQKYWINPLFGKLVAVDNHAAFVYSHSHEIGITGEELTNLGTQDPKDAESSHKAVLAGLRHSWVKAVIRQRQVSFEGINLNNIHGALTLISQEVGVPEKVYLEYYMNGRKIYDIITGNDVHTFIKTGKIPAKNLYDGMS